MSESGRVKGVLNAQKFDAFISLHNQENDWHKYVDVKSKKFNKELICTECGFGKSAFFQNPALKAKLNDLEQDLIRKGILPNRLSQETIPGGIEQDAFIRAFEEKLASYHDDVDKVKRAITSYSQELDVLT